MIKRLILFSTCFSLLSVNISVMAQPLSNQDYEIVQFEKIVKEHKGDRGAYLGLLSLYYDAHKDQKFVALLKTINKKFKKDPQLAGAFVNYAEDYYNKGQYSLAEEVITEIAKYYKNDPRVPAVYARVMMVQGRPGVAISFLKAFIAKKPREIYAYDMLINLYLYEKQYNSAFEYAKLAQEKNLDSIMYYFLEGLALQLIDKQKAMTYYKAYLEKLSIASDDINRIHIAQKIYQTVSQPHPTSAQMKELISYMETKDPASAYMVIQARYGIELFPEDKAFYLAIIEKYAGKYHVKD